MSFQKLNLIDPLKRSLTELNYHTPTPIQAQTIPHALEGRDVLGCAQTGTGKTAAFALPILDFLGGDHRRAMPGQPQALVLAPTRELAIQIADSFKAYGKHAKLRTTVIFGGVNQHHQVKAMKAGAHVLVATPGRLLDLMQQGHIDLSQLEVFVLDEADRMLDMGFLPDLKRIIANLPDDRQSLFFSATLPDSITKLAGDLLFNPVRVNVTPKQTSVKSIEQQLIWAEKADKSRLLSDILRGDDLDAAIVFTRTKRGANVVARKLERDGIESAVIHGNKSQNARQTALDAFRKRRVRVLVATDVAARGIDIDNVTHVINHDLPHEPEAYVHRIGRTGRAGAAGIAVSFCSGEERDHLDAIESLIGLEIPRDPDQPVPRRVAPKKTGGGRSGGGRSGGGRSGGGGYRGGGQRASAGRRNASLPRSGARGKSFRGGRKSRSGSGR